MQAIPWTGGAAVEVGGELEGRRNRSSVHAQPILSNLGSQESDPSTLCAREHPVKHNAGESAVAVTAPDIGVDASEPDFVEARAWVEPMEREIVARLIECHGVTAAIHVGRQAELPAEVDIVAGESERRDGIEESYKPNLGPFGE
jgi:hypothetical protein